MHKWMITVLLLALSVLARGQNIDWGTPEKHCASNEEKKLYQLITAYRDSNKLPKVEFSRSLSYVARVHAMDLSLHRPDFGGCNPHSWSDKGKWKSCCYAQDENRVACMTMKPKELTGYKFKAWEIVYSGGEEAKADDAFNLWKDIGLFNDYLLNTGKWTKRWMAVGVGVYGDYACVWFGEGADAASALRDCDAGTTKSAPISGVTDRTQDSTNDIDRMVVDRSSPNGEVRISSADSLQSPEVIVMEKEVTAWYYIIIAGVNSLEKADALVRELKEGGYKNAMYLPGKSNFRISTGYYPDEDTAYKELEKVREQFPDAWVLKPVDK